jgi:hypothetical protein
VKQDTDYLSEMRLFVDLFNLSKRIQTQHFKIGLLRCVTVWTYRWVGLLTFRRNILPPSSGLTCFSPEDGGVCFSETLEGLPTCKSTRRHIPEDHYGRIHRHENLESPNIFSLVTMASSRNLAYSPFIIIFHSKLNNLLTSNSFVK